MGDRVRRDDVEAYLRGRAGRVVIEDGTHGQQARLTCPACGKARALCVALDGDRAGVWTCFGCNADGGGWRALRALFGDRDDRADDDGYQGRNAAAWASALVRGIAERTFPTRASGAPIAEAPSAATARSEPGHPWAFSEDLDLRCEATLWSDVGSVARDYLLAVRKLPEATVRAFRLGALVLPVRERPERSRHFVVVPVYDASGQLANARFRSVPGVCPVCDGAGCPAPEKGKRPGCDGGKVAKVYGRCPGRATLLFNAGRLPADPSQRVVVTEGELDVVAMHAYGLVDGVVSGTAGAGADLGETALDLLEPYRYVVLAYDADDAGDRGAVALAAKLGRYRCSRARLPRKDAGECLAGDVAEAAVRGAIDRAEPMVKVSVVHLRDLRRELEDAAIDGTKVRGRPTGLRRLDQVFGGWRPGLVVVTGDTSSGKTSLTSWCAREQARRGVPVLLTAFEQRVQIAGKLLRVEMGRDWMEAQPADRAAAWASLDRDPLYVAKHWGQIPPAWCIESIRYAVRRLGVRFAIVDHLGFVVDEGADDERRMIEATIRALVTVAQEDEVTVVLVCHPNRMPVAQKRRVRANDLKGASAIEQDADLVLVVERLGLDKRGRARSKVHVDKCRSEYGLLGSYADLWYDRVSCRYADDWIDLPAASRPDALTVDPEDGTVRREPGEDG